MACSFEDLNDPSAFAIRGTFLEQLSVWQFLNKEFTPWNCRVVLFDAMITMIERSKTFQALL
jgi:hypothetical protein